ncbi:hypothetical protein BGU54_18560 [Clostridioides difficile]|nr:hypothetical protein BGU54_18560 [Clostridioides difficile]
MVPRCRRITSWRCSRSLGLGCCVIEVVLGLGSVLGKTLRSLSVQSLGKLLRPVFSTRGALWTYLWCTSFSVKLMAE